MSGPCGLVALLITATLTGLVIAGRLTGAAEWWAGGGMVLAAIVAGVADTRLGWCLWRRV